MLVTTKKLIKKIKLVIENTNKSLTLIEKIKNLF